MRQTAIEAARKAGHVIREHYQEQQRVTVKGYRDIVTEIDTAAERVIMSMIRERFPGHAILSEEAGGSGSGNDSGIGDGYTWVIDPLDGTTNYARRVPSFAVSIGILEKGEPAIGVVYDPLRDELFVAERGGGSTLNGKPIHASDVSHFGQAVIGLDWSRSNHDRQRTLDILQRVARRCGTVRAFGSAVLMQCYVAAGWLDAYFNLMMKPWDAAAGTLLVTEAGGGYTTVDGGPFRVLVPGCVATNGRIHDELLALIRAAEAKE